MSVAKVPLILIIALSGHVAYTPPTPPATPNERLKELPLGERVFGTVVRHMTTFSKVVVWLGAIGEVAVILARASPSSPAAKFVLEKLMWVPVQYANRIAVTPAFLAGCGLAILGSFLRLQCYRTLGRHFTYELALQNGHQLVTSGPYSVVRHPSYTCLMLCQIGLLLCQATPGSWIMESGILNTLAGKIPAYTSLALQMYAWVNLVQRTAREDGFLKKEFGEQWVLWAKNVPYRLIPGIY